MKKDFIILIAEDNNGKFLLVKKNLQRAGIWNETISFTDGRQLLDFLFMRGDSLKRQHNVQYLLLLDIRMPGANGIEILSQIKSDGELKKMPVIMLTNTDDPQEIERCHSLGCSIYIVKPAEYESFIDNIRKMGMFLSVVRLPVINSDDFGV